MKLFGLSLSPSKRSVSPIPDDRYFTSPLLLNLSGKTIVTPETALQFTAVFAAVRVIAGNLATLPLITYEHSKDGGKEKAIKHPLYKVLKTKPNNHKTTSFEFREMLTGHMLLYGNGYAQIIRNRAGEVIELYPLHPTRVTPKADNKGVFYKVRTDTGDDKELRGSDVLHLRAYRDEGLVGLSPIAAAKKAIEAGLSLESFGTNFFEGGAFPSGVLEYKGELSEPAKDNLRESWRKLYGGENRGKNTAILEDGVTWKQMGIPQTDAQFLEQRRFQVEEISRIYGVPPHLLGDLSRSTNNNIEMQSQEFVSYCLAPWMQRWEQAIVRDLLDGDDEKYFVKHQANALMRGDSAARAAFYSAGRQWGWLSANDIKKLEDTNPIGPEGDVYLSPMNMSPLGDIGKKPEQPKSEPKPEEIEDKEPEDEDEKDTEEVRVAFRGAVKEAWQRVIRKEVGLIKSAARSKSADEFETWKEKFINDHLEFTRNCIRSIGRTFFLVSNRGEPDMWIEKIVSGYGQEISERLEDWQNNPSVGYERSEGKVGDYWTDRLLNYTDGEYETPA